MTNILRDISKIFSKDFRSILCLNAPSLPLLFLKNTHLPIIAADGGFNELIKHGIIPNLVIGDLDSADKNALKNINHLRIDDQDTTDFEKSLDYIKKKSLFPTLVIGINGGHLDHIFYNLYVAFLHDIVFYAPPLIGGVIKQKTTIALPINTKISIFGNCSISTKGLKWDLENDDLVFPNKASCSNRTIDKNITLDIHNGSALIMIHNK